MITGTVVGNVWSTRRLAEIPNGAFLEIALDNTSATIVAFDVLGTGIGERVLVSTGSVAATWFGGQTPPIDALIIGYIDAPNADSSTPQSKAKTRSTQK